MAQVAAVYSIARHERDVNKIMEGGKDTPAPKPQKKRVWASLEHEPQTVIVQMFDEANRRDPKHKREWAVLVDGQRSQLDRVEQQIESRGLESHGEAILRRSRSPMRVLTQALGGPSTSIPPEIRRVTAA